jgi:hypothetical protein
MVELATMSQMTGVIMLWPHGLSGANDEQAAGDVIIIPVW